MKITASASTLAALAALAAGIMLAAPAPADPDTATDDDFLAALDHAGITYHDPYRATMAGRAVCGLMDSGTPGIDVIEHIRNFNPGFSVNGAAEFAAIAANEYCPQHLKHANG